MAGLVIMVGKFIYHLLKYNKNILNFFPFGCQLPTGSYSVEHFRSNRVKENVRDWQLFIGR
jgi:hypothetical protein